MSKRTIDIEEKIKRIKADLKKDLAIILYIGLINKVDTSITIMYKLTKDNILMENIYYFRSSDDPTRSGDGQDRGRHGTRTRRRRRKARRRKARRKKICRKGKK